MGVAVEGAWLYEKLNGGKSNSGRHYIIFFVWIFVEQRSYTVLPLK